jgi:hypothetical protein
VDENPVGQESASGERLPPKRQPRSRFYKALLVDVLCFSTASCLLLVHFLVRPNGILCLAAVALLALAGAFAVYEHVLLARSQPRKRPVPEEPGERQVPQLPRASLLVLVAIIGCCLVLGLAVNSLTGAGVGALVAWVAGWDVSRAAWLGFFAGLIWCIAALGYAVVRGALFVLHARLQVAAEPRGSPPSASA